jgi:hypothetical protein
MPNGENVPLTANKIPKVIVLQILDSNDSVRPKQSYSFTFGCGLKPVCGRPFGGQASITMGETIVRVQYLQTILSERFQKPRMKNVLNNNARVPGLFL